MPKHKVSLSASKIKTLQTCSWIYYATYVLRVPQTTNSGASRGLCAHVVLECLLNPRHKEHLAHFNKSGTFTKSVERLIKINAKRFNVNDRDNLDMVHAMIGTALRYDFLCEGSEKIVAEQKFKIEGDKYIINGFIDKMAHFKDRISILDYKTSKIKFSKDEIESNVQALMYSLACWKNHGIIPQVDFLFLRFPKKPLQQSPLFSESQLKGFERYLATLALYIENFTIKEATKSMASNSKDNRWLCGKEGFKDDGTKHFICQYRKPCTFFKGVDKDGEFVVSSYDRNEILKHKTVKKIQTIAYSGCPAFLH